MWSQNSELKQEMGQLCSFLSRQFKKSVTQLQKSFQSCSQVEEAETNNEAKRRKSAQAMVFLDELGIEKTVQVHNVDGRKSLVENKKEVCDL